MRKTIDTYVQAIAHDNEQYIMQAESIADYIICNAENTDNWAEYFDDSELEEPTCEPTDEQIEELKDYLNKYYNYLPSDDV